MFGFLYTRFEYLWQIYCESLKFNKTWRKIWIKYDYFTKKNSFKTNKITGNFDYIPYENKKFDKNEEIF